MTLEPDLHIQNGSEKVQKVINILKGSADKSAWFPKLAMVPVYEMRLGIVRYNYLTSFETLGHTFLTFLSPQLWLHCLHLPPS